jgi:hypothetical protein
MTAKITLTIEEGDLDALLRILASLRDVACREELDVDQVSFSFEIPSDDEQEAKP